MYLASAAQLRIQKIGMYLNISINFKSNFAQNGTAIYVDDQTYPDICDGGYNMKRNRYVSSNQCFVQVFLRSALRERSTLPNIEFTMNYGRNNTVIFGGLLE